MLKKFSELFLTLEKKETLLADGNCDHPFVDEIFEAPKDPVFSIMIPSWNNFGYLKLCVESVLKNSRYQHQILVHLNEGTDGSAEWLRQKNISFSKTADNVGMCWPLNHLRSFVKAPYIVYLNDDMYLCPDWDERLMAKVKTFPNDMFYLSSSMIEPVDTGNKAVVGGRNYGTSVESFREADLIKDLPTLKRSDWHGSTWPPSLLSTRVWDLVGGYSVEYSPGFYSDPDLSMKLWKLGVRKFLGVGDSLAYHFMSKSTKRVKRNDGRRTFMAKWGMKPSYLEKVLLKRGEPVET